MTKRILLVEDEELLAMLLTGELEDAGFIVERAENGYEAVNMFKSANYSGVVTDLYMPAMDGIQFLQAIDAKDQSIPIAVITGSNTSEVNQSLAELGISHVYHKPIGQNAMQQLIAWLETG